MMENYNKDKVVMFPVAAIFYLILILIGAVAFFRMIPILVENYSFMRMLEMFFRMLTLISEIVLVILVILKKRGTFLMLPLIILAVLPIAFLVVQEVASEWRITLSITDLLFYAPYPLMLCFLIIMEQAKTSSQLRNVSVLWFIPGGVALLNFIFILFRTYRIFEYFGTVELIYTLSTDFLLIPAMLLLGYWIAYLYYYSQKPTVNNAYANHNAQSRPVPPIPPYQSCVPPQTASSEVRFCASCGNRVLMNNAYCPTCGSRLADQLVSKDLNADKHFPTSRA